MKRALLPRTVLGLLLITACAPIGMAANLTIPVGGKVTVQFVFSSAAFSDTLSVGSPTTAVAFSGCKVLPAAGLTGVALGSAKSSQQGCTVTLDSDPATPGVQGFAAGTTFEFRLCADNDGDGTCNNVWSSNPGSNSDGKDHVLTTPIHPSELPGQVFQMNWEDLPNLGDMDFNDYVAVVRVDADTDGDGLWDDWERFGIDTNGDGVVDLDLPALGADPNHKDVFIEIDYMDCATAGGDCATGDTHSHRPKTAAVNAVIQAFANANVNNPDGTTGINLHIDVSNAIAHQNNLNINGLCFNGGTGIGSFDAVKNDPANFGPNNPRRFAYHYALFTHQQVSTSTSSGCGELPGNDFQVALGGWNVGSGDLDGDGLPDANVGTVQQQAGTLMHELGHNLNLGHGGGDGVNFKPNYLSIMNYRFQVSGLPPTDPDGTGPLTGVVDYSRSALANLNEFNLSEAAGIGDGTINTFHVCPNGSTQGDAGNAAIDWDCDGNTTGTGLTGDINGDRACVGPGKNGTLDSTVSGDDVVSGTTIWDGPDHVCNSTASGDDQQIRTVGNAEANPLTGYWDWANLKLDFQNTAAFESGDHTSQPVIELDYPTFLNTIAPDLKIAMSASPDPVLTGSDVTYQLTVTNLRPAIATNVVVADVLPAATTFVSCAANGGGVCAGSGNSRTITFASIPGGSTATITLVANVNCPVPNGTSISNTASVSSTPVDADATNNSATAAVTASNPPPVISGISVDKPVLWPPNNQMVAVTVNYTVKDNCGDDACVLTVSSNEPVNGVGDGNASPDWQIVDAHHVLLRAQRSGTGTGRVYTITITCTDSANNSTVRTTTVTVPHDQGN